MTDIEVFESPEIELTLPKAIDQAKYRAVSCLKIENGCSAYLLEEVGSGKRHLLKISNDPVISVGLANEKKLLEFIHREQSELSDTFPQPGLFFSDSENSWYMRNFIRGKTLAELVDENPKMPGIPKNQAIGYILQVAELLKFLHTLTPPIIHRDIKPQNVVVDDEGVCHLIDMGISRVFNNKKDEDTVIMGTKSTMPPEQFGYSQTDARSDIYSLGILLNFCLTGEYTAPESPTDGLDPDIFDIIKRATQFDPNSRYQTAEEFLADLVSARYGKISAQRASEKPKHRIAKVCAVLAAVVAAAIGIALFNGLNRTRVPDGVVKFDDPILEEAVRLELDKPVGDLTEEDLDSITSIRIAGSMALAPYNGVMSQRDGLVVLDWNLYNLPDYKTPGGFKDLKPFTVFENLESLLLANEELDSFDGLEDLKKLTNLDLTGCAVKDQSGIVNTESVTNLVLNSMKIDDVSLLAQIPSLSTLSLDYSDFGDIPNPEDFRLYHLSVIGGSLKDYSVINKLRGLSSLNADYDAEQFRNMKDAPILYLNVIVTKEDDDLAELKNFEYLEHLGISLNSGLSWTFTLPEGTVLPRVSYLYFTGDFRFRLHDLDLGGTFPRLNTVNFSSVTVESLDGLDEISQLVEIECSTELASRIETAFPDNNWELRY